jgi:chromosome segregation ATPase
MLFLRKNDAINIFDMEVSCNSTFTNQIDFLKQLTQDNKTLVNELRSQLSLNESIQSEKSSLEEKYNQLLRDAELTRDRNDLITKRNTHLVKEISKLKEELERKEKEYSSSKADFEALIASKDKQIAGATSNISMLERDIIQRDVRILQGKKEIKALTTKLSKKRESLRMA